MIGVVLMITRVELSHKIFFFYGVPVYMILIGIALILNVCFYYLHSTTEDFNMFYISPFQDGILPVITALRKKAYAAFLILYIVISSFYGYLLFFAGLATKYVYNKIRVFIQKRKEKKEEFKEECIYFFFNDLFIYFSFLFFS
jgi:hypothetical protein